MTNYNPAEIVSQIAAAAVQCFEPMDEAEADARSALVVSLVKEIRNDIGALTALALLGGRVIHEYDEHLQIEHDKSINRQQYVRAVLDAMEIATRNAEDERKGRGTADTEGS